jgi:hypothetical protein
MSGLDWLALLSRDLREGRLTEMESRHVPTSSFIVVDDDRSEEAADWTPELEHDCE